ncbi:matrix-remodeling-associated protein 7 isoform X3 [Rissa tridactyla]|uniref:matrix-remodeling-associated protein 7 isoform X3 n=1 Tax=Rissa tridactyla TaxID=75485 RepID=UPI0023BAB068|nr:matrix-remodeling-associated protein 7 isoform X3 [Rissa tridactyla]
MDVAVDLYLAVPLLFTVLAIVLASVFVRLRGGEGERAAEPAAAEPAREGGPGGEAAAAPEEAGPEAAEGPEDEGARVPVEEVGAGEEGKEAAGEQREAVAEPGPAGEPSPAAAESIPRPPPAESIPRPPPAESIPRPPPAESIPRPPPAESIPRPPPAEPQEPGNREDAENKIPPLGASPGSSLGHTGQAEGGCGHAALSSKAEEEDPDSENEKLVVREPEDEDAADETFSFKYSPGKLRGNQYKSMMTKEELEEEQRTEDYMKLSLASS